MVKHNKKNDRWQQSMIIIECDADRQVFFYVETESHFAKCEPVRIKDGLRRLSWSYLANECEIGPGEYLVIPIIEHVKESDE